jgi:methionine biosynthesis protein MetW
MQQVHKPRKAIIRALKIGKTIIVGFPNFCNIRARIQITLGGRVPVTPSLPYSWYDTPNLHFLSIRDFRRFCRREGIRIRKAFYLTQRGRIRLLPNLLADNAIFVLERGKASGFTV